MNFSLAKVAPYDWQAHPRLDGVTPKSDERIDRRRESSLSITKSRCSRSNTEGDFDALDPMTSDNSDGLDLDIKRVHLWEEEETSDRNLISP